MKRTLLVITASVLFSMAGLGGVARQQPQKVLPKISNGKIHVEPVRGNVFMLAGSGGNITLQAGPEGVLLVDTGVAERVDDVLGALQDTVRYHLHDLSGVPSPIRYIINTGFGSEHIGGNWKIAQSKLFDPVFGGEQIIAHGNVLNRITEELADKASAPGTITDAYFTEYYKLNRFLDRKSVV